MILVFATVVGAVEASMLIFCGLRLVNATFDLRRVVYAGVTHALLIRGARLLLYNVFSVPSPAHIPVALILFLLVVRFIVRMEAVISVLAVTLGFLILSMGAGLVMVCMPRVDVTRDSVLVMLMLTEQLPLAITTFIIGRWRLRLVSGRTSLAG